MVLYNPIQTNYVNGTYSLVESAYGDRGIYLIGQGPTIDQGSANNKHHNIYNTEIRGNRMIHFVTD